VVMSEGVIIEANTGRSAKHAWVMQSSEGFQCMDCCQWTRAGVEVLDTVECDSSLPAETMAELAALEVKPPPRRRAR